MCIRDSNKRTLAVRFPKHPLTRCLLEKLSYPLAAPSANLSSKVSAVSSNDVKEDFGKKIKFVLEGGKSSIGIESTIVDLRNKPKILRLGGLEISSIQNTLSKKIKINNNPSIVSAPELQIADKNHKWGLAAFHYIPEYYVSISNQIDVSIRSLT